MEVEVTLACVTLCVLSVVMVVTVTRRWWRRVDCYTVYRERGADMDWATAVNQSGARWNSTWYGEVLQV